MRGRYQHPGETVPNLAPMVDVIMVLLVFFLLGATLDLARQGVLRTELDPSSGPGAGVAIDIHPRVRIMLRDVDDGDAAAVELNDRRLGLLEARPYDLTIEREQGQAAALADYFGSLYTVLDSKVKRGADVENPVVIGAETTVRWKFVAKAMDAAVKTGFKNIQFAVSFRPPEEE